MKFIEKIVFFLGWLRIVFSPLLAGLIIGFCCYGKFRGTLGISFVSIGLIAGTIWAELSGKNTEA
ncbi:MAG TPA: hypothetical protein VFJ43_11980 [Bacteroidia bacterium]|nr:hypothetical protein [Bacteroidia bacterium]